MPTNSIDFPMILREVGLRRRRENIFNAFKVVGIFLFALAVTGAVAIVVAPEKIEETTALFGFAAMCFTVGLIDMAIKFVLVFWPFLIYFWATAWTVRQRTLLSLIQTALEAGTPLPDMIRAYAAGCFRGYRFRLERFAATLDGGCSLEEAVRENSGLFRYDIAGMLRLGGNDSETLRSMESVAQEERDFAPIQTNSIVRIAYLFTLASFMMSIVAMMMTFIAPQFEKIFKDFYIELPQMTLGIMIAAKYFVKYWYFYSLLIPLVGLFLIAYLILQMNVVVARPPLFRKMFRSTDAAKFLRIFAVGMKHHVPIPGILTVYRFVVPSGYLQGKAAKINLEIERGKNWIDAVQQERWINAPEASLLRSAERTGNTPVVLDQLALSKTRAQIREDDLFSKLVFIPLIFLFGAVVGYYVIAMFLPLLKLVTVLSSNI